MRVRARKVEEDGIVFDSLTEHARYRDLKLLQRSGDISKLQVHPTFKFVVAGMEVGKYTPDFSYQRNDGKHVIEDAKGFKKSKKTGRLLPRVDREFGLKRKLMKALFALDVEIV